MAEEQDELVSDAESRSNKKWWIIGSAAVMLIAALSILYLIGAQSDAQLQDTDSRSRSEHSLDEALYVALPSNFIFNVTGTERDRIAQIGVQLLVRGADNETLAHENIPLIEATLLEVFSRATAERLATSEGKREIRIQALDALRTAMRDATNGSSVVDEVLFTNFVMQ